MNADANNSIPHRGVQSSDPLGAAKNVKPLVKISSKPLGRTILPASTNKDTAKTGEVAKDRGISSTSKAYVETQQEPMSAKPLKTSSETVIKIGKVLSRMLSVKNHPLAESAPSHSDKAKLETAGSAKGVEKLGEIVQQAREKVTTTAAKTDSVVKEGIFKEITISHGDETHVVNLQYLTEGKAKKIWKAQIGAEDHFSENFTKFLEENIFITAVSTGKEGEITEEVGLSKEMVEDYKAKHQGKIPEHLHIDFEKMEGTKEFLVRAPKAYCDLEQFIKDPSLTGMKHPPLTRMQRLKLVRDVIKAMQELHSIGVVAGDLKPENFLVFKNDDGSYTVKLSDFGKSKRLGDRTTTYSGNTRFGPRNGVLSKSGDVEGMAGVIARILEEECLQENDGGAATLPLEELGLTYARKDQYGAASIRRGFERFKVDNPVFNAVETLRQDNSGKWVKRGKWALRMIELPRRLKIRGASRNQQKIEMQAVNQYLEGLGKKLGSGIPGSENEINETMKLLMEMNGNEKRPNMDQVDARFDKILEDVEKREAEKLAELAAQETLNEASSVMAPIGELVSSEDLSRGFYDNIMKNKFTELGKLALGMEVWQKSEKLKEKNPNFRDNIVGFFKDCIKQISNNKKTQEILASSIIQRILRNVDPETEMTKNQRQLLEELFKEAAAELNLKIKQKPNIYR